MAQLSAAGAILALLAMLALLALILLWRLLREPATGALPPETPTGLADGDSDWIDRIESMAGFGGWDYDIGARRLSWSPQLFRLLGLEDRGVAPDLDSQLAMVLEADRARISDAIAALLDEGSDLNARLQIRNGRGEIRHLRITGLARRDADGRLLRLLGTVGDFTASEDIQLALADSLKQAGHQSSLLRTINRSTLLVARKLGDPDLIQMLTEELRSAIGAQLATLLLLRSYDDPRLVSSISISDQYAKWRGFGAPMFADLQLVADIPAGRGVVRLSEAELLAHPELCALATGTATRPMLKGLLSVPVFNHAGSLVGLLALSDPADGKFSPDDEFIALAFSQIASAHIDIARLVGKVQRSSHALSDNSAESEQNRRLLEMAEQLDGIGLFQWRPASPGNDAIELSPTLQRNLGFESARTDAATLASLCIDEDRPLFDAAVSDARAGRARDLKLRFKRRQGGLRWLQVCWEVRSSGDQLCIYGMVKDASQAHRDARILQQTREDLAQREGEAGDLDAMMLEHLSPRLQQLGTAVAKLHESLPPDEDGAMAQAFTRLAATCASIDDVFAGMVKYMHVLAPGGTRLTIRPSELLNDALGDFDPVLLEIGARVTCGDLPEIHADPVLMRIVFRELVDNAIKFRHPERRLEITVSARLQPAAGQPGYRQMVLSFTDNGLGFESRLAAKAFSPLVRLQRREDFPGHGMGLALVKCISERHGGRATVESQLGTGTAVRIELPYHAVAKELQGSADRVPDKESINES